MVLGKDVSEYVGLGLAIAIIALWFSSGIFCITQPDLSPWQIAIGIAIRTFLHTGLFILAHDSMHGSLVPNSPPINKFFGQFTVGLYACLSYKRCAHQHQLHHLQPAQQGDPDFHDGIHTHPIHWYFHFLRHYFSLRQFSLFLGVVLSATLIFHHFLNATYLSLITYFLLPLLFSSLQLFIFGTYLPHRQGTNTAKPTPLPHSLRYLWSLISCYHFGLYHQEHHASPYKPWFRLPLSSTS
ncbi:MAG: beta-carotene ketolase [Limnothrix sp. RL_2_0]|nr:beta-carotene ketolase [Limnothrix sp. RL_2_0]